MVWFKFFLCLAVILFSGVKLARYGDAIAKKTGLGGIWIGLLLLATITSMPELVTGVSSAALVGLPDLALGTLLGSCLINLAILALLDILYRSNIPVLSQASSRHIALAGWGMLLVAIPVGGILAGEELSGLALGWVGIPSIIILTVYLLGIRRIFHAERNHQVHLMETSPSQYTEITVRTACSKFALAAAAVIVAGIWMSFIGDEIAETTGWGATFVGSMFLAITTSAPELVVTIAALRLGAIDMAVADILGSNMFNIAIIFVVDLFYTQGSILSSVSSSHLISGATVAAMSLIVIVGLRFQQKHKTFVCISWHALVLIGLYIFGAYALFTSSINP